MLSVGAKIGEEERRSHTSRSKSVTVRGRGMPLKRVGRQKAISGGGEVVRRGPLCFLCCVFCVFCGCVNAAWRLERSHRLDRGGRGDDGGAHKQRGHRWRRHQLRGVRLHRRL